MKRRVHRIERAGDLRRLKLQEEDLASPGKNEVCIEVKAVGLNYADIFALMGMYSATPKGSFIPGLEVSGLVQSVGKEVKNLKEGERVIAVTRFGGYSSHLNISKDYVYPLKSNWSFAEGAAFAVQALTAYYALFPLGNLKEGNVILIQSAAGGVGLMANRIAKLYKAYTIGSIGNPEKIELLKKEGYDRYIIRDEHFGKELQQILSDKELHLVLECIGGKIFEESYKALSPTGRLVTYGSAHFTPMGKKPNYIKLAYQYLKRPKIDPLQMISDNKSVLGFNLIWLWERLEILRPYFEALWNLELEPPYIGKTFSFEKALEALEYFKTGNSVGKIILTL
ncbi:MAG: zinc-binding dehydrogenase [Leptospiraceae bacterium]|nr:zinc-binding dehydrogenase [Leptospiraceae bacterium]MCP5498872.1 zinc-binding dehydrogenase [Leptospiraceae bacterium]